MEREREERKERHVTKINGFRSVRACAVKPATVTKRLERGAIGADGGKWSPRTSNLLEYFLLSSVMDGRGGRARGKRENV